MTNNHTTPKIDSFRTIVGQAVTLYAEISTISTAISNLETIKARIGDCRSEADARRFVSDLTRAEEAVTIKRIREPRMLTDLAALLASANDAKYPAFREAENLLTYATAAALAGIADLLKAVQFDPQPFKPNKVNDMLVEDVRPNVLARRQADALRQAMRNATGPSDPLTDQVVGVKTLLAALDKTLAALPEIAAEAKRLAVACDAFIKALTKRW